MGPRIPLLIAIIAAGCGSQLKPGFCDKNADCPAGNYCSQIQSATSWHRCFPIGDGGPPDSVQPCTSATCNGPAPICDSTTKVCRACATGDECSTIDPNARACVSGACVQCAVRTDCAAPTPACDIATYTCVGCTAATASSDCVAPKPACDRSTNSCVECIANSDCRTKTKPICDTGASTCRACASDSECPASPGICVTDGHCATTAEVIYVQNTSSTCNEAGTGTAAAPLCSLQPLLPLLSATRDLVVVRGSVDGGKWNYAADGGGNLFIVGQQNAAIASGTSPAFAMQSGSVSMRGIRLSSSASVGIGAKGGVLTLDHVTVDSCMGGGILLDGAAFDIENTTVTRNGPAQQPVVWGGILVNSLPASGPKLLKLVTIQNNMAPGLFCGAGNAIQGDGVFASGNAALDVASACNVTPCMSAGPDCGAQP